MQRKVVILSLNYAFVAYLQKNIAFIGFCVLVCVSFIGCKETAASLPGDKNKIVSVLEDLYIAESMADGADMIVRDSVKNEYLNQVVRRHGMTRNGLDSLLLQLAAMPDSLYVLQGLALDSLRAKQLLIREKENLGL